MTPLEKVNPIKKNIIFRGYVGFRECIWLFKITIPKIQWFLTHRHRTSSRYIDRLNFVFEIEPWIILQLLGQTTFELHYL